MTRLGRTSHLVATLVLLGTGVVGLVGCGPTSDEAKRRVRVLAEDPIKKVRPPEGRLLRQNREAGHGMSPGGAADTTEVSRVYSFSGDTRTAALSVAGQIRQAGWTVTATCDTTTGSFSLAGRKSFDTFDASMRATIEVTQASPARDGIRAYDAEPQVSILLWTPYADEHRSGSRMGPPPLAPTPGTSDCLVDPPGRVAG